MFSAKIILRPKKSGNKASNAPAPVYIRIIKDRKVRLISTGIKISPDQWDDKTLKVKRNHPNSARMNAMISQKYFEIENLALEMEAKGNAVTAYSIKEKAVGKKAGNNFFDLARAAMEVYEKHEMFGTFDKCKAILSKIRAFHGSDLLLLPEITPSFLNKYDGFCRTEFGNKTNTIHKDLKFIRKVFNDALRLDIIEYSENPFLKFKLKTEKTQRTFLNEEELELLMDADCTSGTRMDLHRDMFVFSAFAGGLRISDLLLLKWENVDKTHLRFTIRKTGTQVSVKLPDKANEILSKYRPKNPVPHQFVFPMLNNNLNLKDARMVDRAITTATAYINKNLKLLAVSSGITKHISFHISRHTFATRALKKGISVDKVQKLLGHSAIKETQIYAKIVNEELDKAMDLFN